MARNIKPLTGIRGIAACWVVVTHVIGEGSLTHSAGAILRSGYLAVDLFFILSGYVMALSYGRFVTEGWTRKKYGLFLRRRFARIYPLYLVTILVFLKVFGVSPLMLLPDQNVNFSLLMNFLLMQSWGSNTQSINVSAWSISTEAFAYMLFPVLGALTIKARHWSFVLLVTLVCVTGIFLLYLVPTPPGMPRNGPLDVFFPGSIYPLIRCLCEFTLGLIAYRLSQSASVRKWAAYPATIYIIIALLLISLMRPEANLVFVILLPFFILALGAGDNPVTRVIGGKVVFFLGEISYSLYLLHIIFLKVMENFGNNESTRWFALYRNSGGINPLGFAIMTASLILCSWLAYRLIEKPCRDMLHGQ